MFKKLRNRIIIITMAVTTTILVLSGVLIMVFSSTTRPDPKPEPDFGMPNPALYDDQELKDFIKNDRKEGSERLLVTLLCVGAIIEVATFLIIYFASQKIVEPVKDSYNKQKIFIANASHELKTPLAIIQANMEALDVNKENEKWKSNIENEINHANKLVLDLLQLAKMDAGNTKKSAPVSINLKAEIEKRIEMFKPKFTGDISFKDSSDNKTIKLPKQDFLQVLDILLDNATKYGNKKISILLDNNGFTVTNDGATIPRKDQEKIFDRFYQADKTKDGSGLGLAIAKALCEQNGWRITCESRSHRTYFIVTFDK
ncbi:HAMP domain-containing histidine kinase [Candidatus Saccharibacteria bacterium]|nr:HAMP domain-containing histidine kinase [Candidatus Saccharibacteria bacterium]MBR3256062.1 HAMP domain-containing histidine kinase [Candidatus Saccharibacteria bacterium]